jgi:hypothetical protein
MIDTLEKRIEKIKIHLKESNIEFVENESIDFYRKMLFFNTNSIPFEFLNTRFYDILSFTVVDSTGMHWNTGVYYDPELRNIYKSFAPQLPSKDVIVEHIIRSKFEMKKKVLNSTNIIISYFEEFMEKSIAKYGKVYDFNELIDVLTAPPPFRFHNKFINNSSKEQYGIWHLCGVNGFDSAVHNLVTYQDIGQLHVGISCIKHGRFDVIANKHLKDGICPECKRLLFHISAGAQSIKDTLNILGLDFEQEYYLSKLGATGISSKLRFDFYIPSLRAAIEYDGEQHFNPIVHWGGEESLEKTKERDILKNNFCKENVIQLLRVPYTSSKVSKVVFEFIAQCYEDTN